MKITTISHTALVIYNKMTKRHAKTPLHRK